MNRTSLPHRTFLRRLAAIAGGALLGVTAALTFAAAPASAHHSVVKGEPVCDTSTGEWVVTWTVRTFAPPGVDNYKLIEVVSQPTGNLVADILASGPEAPYALSVNAALVGTQRLPGDATTASLGVRAEWENKFVERNLVSATIQLGGDCKPNKPEPNVSFSSACDGSVTVTLSNSADAKVPALFKISGVNKVFTVKPGESEQVVVPAEVAGKIVVKSGKKKFEGAFEQPQDCEPLSLAAKSDCDSLTVSIENPKGSAPVEVTLTPNNGEAQVVKVAPGETKEATFEAEEGLTVTPSIEDEAGEAIAWTEPADCGGTGGGDSLPLTGASVTGAIGVAAGLLAIGAVLFFVFRRRRVRFTA